MWRIRGLWEKGWGRRMHRPQNQMQRDVPVISWLHFNSKKDNPPDVSDLLPLHIFPFLSFLCCFMLFITDIHPSILLSLSLEEHREDSSSSPQNQTGMNSCTTFFPSAVSVRTPHIITVTHFSRAAATSWRPWGLVLFLSQITVLHSASNKVKHLLNQCSLHHRQSL